MILQRSNHPSVMLPELWLLINPYKIDSITREHKIHGTVQIEITTDRDIPQTKQAKAAGQPKRTIKKVIRNQKFNIVDKQYLECCIGLSQLKKRPLVFDETDKGRENLKTVLEWMGLLSHKNNRKRILESLQRVGSLTIDIEDQNQEIIQVFPIEGLIQVRKNSARSDAFSDSAFSVTIDGSAFSSENKTKKKYLFHSRSERLLSFMDFIQVRVQQRNRKKSKKHPRDFRYRSFTKMDVLRWYGLWDEYLVLLQDKEKYSLINSNSKEKIKETNKKIKKINNFIAEILREMEKYQKDHNLEFPLYKYDRYDEEGKYRVKDYRYKEKSIQEKTDLIYDSILYEQK